MTVYNMDLSEKLVSTANAVLRDSDGDFDSFQAVSYLSLLACEIAMKALLERAGFPPETIRKRSHNLSLLLKDFCDCEVPFVIHEETHWVRATDIRGKPIQSGTSGTVGQVLEGESRGASKYPNQIRYGTQYSHFPPGALLETAKQVITWGHQHWDSIRMVQEHGSSNQ